MPMETIQDFSHMEANSEQDDESVCGSSSPGEDEQSSSRDEAAEVRKQSAKETARVRTWRTLVAIALFATAVAVTATTYYLLVQDEEDAFRTVFAQFARTMGDASLRQQMNLREAYEGLADDLALTAEVMGNGVPQWPFFWPPLFEHMAADFVRISRAEWVATNNIVPSEDKEAFENFTLAHFETNYKESHLIRYGNLDKLDTNFTKYQPHLHHWKNGSFREDLEERDFYLVRTMQSPPPTDYARSPNWNMFSGTWTPSKLELLKKHPGVTLFGNASKASFLTVSKEEHKGFHTDDNAEDPHAYSVHGVHRVVGNDHSELVGWIIAYIAFDQPLRNLLPDNVRGMLGVISNSCNSTFSYVIDGKEAHFKGYEDIHEPGKYDDMVVDVDLSLGMDPELASQTDAHCVYHMRIYPTKTFEDDYKTATPAIFAAVVAATFVIVAIVFIMYDHMVLKRNEKMIANAAKSNAIVSSVVPDHLRDRLLNSQQESPNAKGKNGTLKTFLSSQHVPGGGPGMEGNPKITTAPLADLFLEATVCFADIVGFTAWSSVREPSQVFTLLETLYQSFDAIAKKRRVFKVETVGDCYVAVCGLPDPRRDHSVAMARFARDIVASMNVLTNELVVLLGPDTGDLMLRVGLHTGPVTAGVLRGERARFQLFGDTMNTCARMESSSKPNRIQCSRETAEHLMKMGRGNWAQKRPEPVVLKGKGTMEAYWVSVRGDRAESAISGVSSGMAANGAQLASTVLQPDPTDYSSTNFVALQANLSDRTGRLIDWNCEVLMKLLKEIKANQLTRTLSKSRKVDEAQLTKEFAAMPLEEVREIVTMPAFDSKSNKQEVDADSIELTRQVKGQLHSFVSTIAGLYRDNSFHNFEHASHVLMSVTKLMSRIVPPSNLEDKAAHDHTFGINADPLTRFACAFSALIHDVDHTGVSNAQLVKEEDPLAKKYKDRSVAEQNSLDLSWNILMKDDYKDLRAHLFQTQDDLVRFRHLVINSVMATDIVDKDLKALRNNRWEKAFNPETRSSQKMDAYKDRVDRKATIVIEHIIQASDISHTMQHWFVYRKWNENLFNELYVAYLNGKLDKDPASFWYKGEIGFFDFYIIPLTKKLKECGVFGVSSDEYLNYALKNREEWEARGEAVVLSLAEEAKKKYGVKGMPRLVEEPQESAPEQAPPQVDDKFQDEELVDC